MVWVSHSPDAPTGQLTDKNRAPSAPAHWFTRVLALKVASRVGELEAGASMGDREPSRAKDSPPTVSHRAHPSGSW